ncbi:hypothetical protein [Porphyromonas loveana]|uniref:hypothetical protein n=1 Tax=Porphyromonas loveana TaxID=1884669 RepID=UPI0035A0916D
MKRKALGPNKQSAKGKPLTPRFHLYWLGILIFAVAFTGMLLGDFNAEIRPASMELFFHISGAVAFCFALAEQAAVYVGHKQGRIPCEQAMRYAGFMDRNGSWSAPLICLTFVAFGLMTVMREGVNTWDLAIGWFFVVGFGYAIVRFFVRLFRKK